MSKLTSRFLLALFVASFALLLAFDTPENAEDSNEKTDSTIVDEWNSVIPPAPPELKNVTVEDPKTTALLILDIQNNSCNTEQRPRCVTSVPKIKKLLDLARDNGISVVYSLTSTAKPEDIVASLEPNPDDPIVKSSVDKFYNTDLDTILKEKGIKSVIVVGTVAHGAVLHTAIGAAIRGYQVIVPVDGMSADNLYAEQYTAWHLLNSPGARNKMTLTKTSLIQVKPQ